MITLTAKINLLSGDNKALLLGSDNLSGNNISSNLRGIVGDKKQGSNPFILGASKLGDGSTFSDGVDYFIGEQLSNSVGDFVNPYVITIKDKTAKLRNIIFSFDKINNRYPKKILLTTEPIIEEKFVYYDKIIQTTVSSTQFGDTNSAILLFKYEDFPKEVSIEDVVITFVSTQTIPFEYEVVEAEWYGGYQITIKRSNGSAFLQIPIEIKFVKEKYYEIGDYKIISSYEDDDAIYNINLPSSEKHTFIIENWNTPNYPIIITGIYADISIDIDRKNLISISRSIFDRSDLKLPSWGIISNTGNIEFNDTDGEIRDYAEQLLLESGLKCEIKLNNTLVNGASQTIGVFETDEWNYDNDNRVVSVSLKDDLEEWQDINVQGMDLQTALPLNKLYIILYNQTPSKYNLLSYEKLNENTQEILENTVIQYPFLESGSLWEKWTKLCEVCQLHIYKDNNGVVVCRYNGGN